MLKSHSVYCILMSYLRPFQTLNDLLEQLIVLDKEVNQRHVIITIAFLMFLKDTNTVYPNLFVNFLSRLTQINKIALIIFAAVYLQYCHKFPIALETKVFISFS